MKKILTIMLVLMLTTLSSAYADDKDKNKDKEKGKDKEDEKGDKKKQEDDKKKDKKPRPNQLTPEQIKQLLEAMNNEENKTQKKLNAEKAKGKKIKQEKDW